MRCLLPGPCLPTDMFYSDLLLSLAMVTTDAKTKKSKQHIPSDHIPSRCLVPGPHYRPATFPELTLGLAC